ncbi:MAG: hypothetical protein L0312_08065, partial [Acidobacteria bacterium]|nr:hypothetical protein [Acidobacteriota bacterium]
MSLLKNFVVWTGLVLLVLLALIWFVSPLLGLTRVDLRLFAALVLLVLWAVLVFLKRNQPALDAAPQLKIPSPTVPAAMATGAPSNDRVTEFRSQLDRAIQWLRGSKLGKTGQDVVYRLPWYLVLGPQGSGKSTLISKSRLSFPYSDPDRSLSSRGLEPTRNCDLWIANEAIFIDAAGRYSLDDQDKDTWSGLLEQLKRLRRDKPLDGILLTVDIA